MNTRTSQNLLQLSEEQLSKYSYTDLSRMSGLKWKTIHKRINEMGWSYYDAVNTPLLKCTKGNAKPTRTDRSKDIAYTISQGIHYMRLQPKFPHPQPMRFPYIVGG